MRTLYIIGNGFDLYHGLDTSYQSFAKYLSNSDNFEVTEIYELLVMYYYLPNLTCDSSDEEYGMWATFEDSLANLDYEQALLDKSHYIVDLSANDFRDRDWHAYQIEMELLIDKLTTQLISVFELFILGIDYPVDISDRKISLEINALFLNFNYTDSLERYYNIDKYKILHIHNKATNNCESIILGHGTDPSYFKVKESQPPTGLTEDQLEIWREHMSEQYDYSYESAKEEILSYYTTAFKNTQSIIIEKKEFFEKLSNVDSIIVLGHSISQVDIGYFKEVHKYVKSNAIWTVSYYSQTERTGHFETLLDIGIKRKSINQILISSIKIQ